MADNNNTSRIKSEFEQMTENLEGEVKMFFNKLTEMLVSNPGEESIDTTLKGGDYSLTNAVRDTTNAHFFWASDNSDNDFLVKKIELIRGTDLPPPVIREMHALYCLKHDNIIRLQHVRTEGKYIFLVMENLDDVLADLMTEKTIDFPRKTKDVVRGILSGIQYCHSNGFIHGDLNPQNIHITIDEKNDKIKLAGFGSAIFVTDTLDSNIGSFETMEYKAPEILMGAAKYSNSIDMWSFGCIFAQILDVNNEVLFEGNTEAEVLNKIFSMMGFPTEESWPGVSLLPLFPHGTEKSSPKDLHEIFPQADDIGLDLLRRCLSLNPDGRISATQALAHPFLN